MNIQSTLSMINKADPIMTGKESFPVIGEAITASECQAIMERCKGLKRHWNCIEKAIIVRDVLGKGEVVIGSLLVCSSDYKSQYGYYFNPPLEFHAWVELDQNIIDVSLFGVIEKGLTTFDHIGAFLTGRKPFILAGKPLDFLLYERMDTI